MTFIKLIVCFVWLAPDLLIAQETKVTEVLSKDLSDLPAKEGLMITVEYPPGASDPIHRHNGSGHRRLVDRTFDMALDLLPESSACAHGRPAMFQSSRKP